MINDLRSDFSRFLQEQLAKLPTGENCIDTSLAQVSMEPTEGEDAAGEAKKPAEGDETAEPKEAGKGDDKKEPEETTEEGATGEGEETEEPAKPAGGDKPEEPMEEEGKPDSTAGSGSADTEVFSKIAEFFDEKMGDILKADDEGAVAPEKMKEAEEMCTKVDEWLEDAKEKLPFFNYDDKEVTTKALESFCRTYVAIRTSETSTGTEKPDESEPKKPEEPAGEEPKEEEEEVTEEPAGEEETETKGEEKKAE